MLKNLKTPDDVVENYRTPKEEKNRSFWDRLFRIFNLYFYFRSFSHILRFAKTCRKEGYNHERILHCCQEVLRTVERTGATVDISGLELVDSSPRVFIGNHMSSLETVTLSYVLSKSGPITFVVKQELFDYPAFGDIMKAMDCIPMTRTNPRQDLKVLMEKGIQHLKEGRSVIVFPQKTRAEDFKPDEMSSIGVKLAKRAGVPVQPLALETSLWGRGSMISDYGPVRRDRNVCFAFGPLIDREKEELNDKQIHQRVLDFISGKLVEWRPEKFKYLLEDKDEA